MSSTSKSQSYIQIKDTPGPALYFKKDIVEDFKSKVIKQTVQSVPFGTTSERNLKTVKPDEKVQPGPGAYIDPNDPNYSTFGSVFKNIQ